MEIPGMSSFLLGSFWIGWRRRLAWAICIGAIFVLSAIRVATEAEFVFASSALLPVLVIAWIDGKRGGLLLAFLATALWSFGDFASGREYSADWIPWTNAVTRLLTYSLVAVLVPRFRLHLEEEHEHAMLDPLTGLLNRRAFLAAGEAEVRRSQRYLHPMAVVFLDLDDFKKLNDSRGHETGDAALRATARALLGALRGGDQVARLGGDEFAILLPEIGYAAALETGRKILAAAGSALANFPPVRESIGVAWFEAADRPFPAMLKAADELMYEVKEGGKGDMRIGRFAPPREAGEHAFSRAAEAGRMQGAAEAAGRRVTDPPF